MLSYFLIHFAAWHDVPPFSARRVHLHQRGTLAHFVFDAKDCHFGTALKHFLLHRLPII
jgi:hypothetical protein